MLQKMLRFDLVGTSREFSYQACGCFFVVLTAAENQNRLNLKMCNSCEREQPLVY